MVLTVLRTSNFIHSASKFHPHTLVMDTQASTNGPRVAKLQGSSDYGNWSTIMQFWLDKEDLWDHVDGAVVKPEATVTSSSVGTTVSTITDANPTFKAWKSNDSKAKYAIISNVSPQNQLLIRNEASSAEMWTRLKTLYQDSGFNHSAILYNRIQTLRLSDCKDAHDYCVKFQTTMQDLALLGHTVGNQQAAANFLNGIGSEYPMWMYMTRANAQKDVPTIETLVADLLNEARNAHTHPKAKGGKEAALVATDDGEGSKEKSKDRNTSCGKGFKGQCTYCKKGRHAEEECWKRYPEKNPFKGDGNNSGDTGGPAGNANAPEDNKQRHGAFASIAQAYTHPKAFNTSSGPSTRIEEWVVDTGATHHLCWNRNAFQDYTETDIRAISGISGSTNVAGLGTVPLQCRLEDGSAVNIVLKNVLHVPNALYNLLSTNVTQEAGIHFRTQDSNLYVPGGPILGWAPLKNCLQMLRLSSDNAQSESQLIRSNSQEISTPEYLGDAGDIGNGLELNVVNKSFNYASADPFAAPALGRKVSYTTIHRRLGHLGLSYIEKVAKNVRGIDLKGLALPEHTCEACMTAQQKRKPSRIPMKRANQIVDFIHVDCIGPLTPEGYDGLKWCIVFTDDYFRYRFVLTMKRKGEAHRAIIEFWRMLHVQTNRKIKRMRLDNGREFGGKALVQWFKTNGILYEPTVAYAADQNGVAERSGGLLLTRTRAMMHDSGLDLELWPEAIQTAAHLLNRSPTVACGDRLPYQLWKAAINRTDPTDEMPDLSYLRIFGSIAHVQIPKEVRVQGRKFDV